MPITTTHPRKSTRNGRPFNPGRRHRANFARQAVFLAFGSNGFALDQGNFVDRLPGEVPRPSPEARFK